MLANFWVEIHVCVLSNYKQKKGACELSVYLLFE